MLALSHWNTNQWCSWEVNMCHYNADTAICSIAWPLSLSFIYSLKNPATSIAYAQGNIGTSLAQNVSQSCDYWLDSKSL